MTAEEISDLLEASLTGASFTPSANQPSLYFNSDALTGNSNSSTNCSWKYRLNYYPVSDWWKRHSVAAFCTFPFCSQWIGCRQAYGQRFQLPLHLSLDTSKLQELCFSFHRAASSSFPWRVFIISGAVKPSLSLWILKRDAEDHCYLNVFWNWYAFMGQ